MSETLKYLMDNISQLSTQEKAIAAHCLLSSMNSNSDDNVDKEWLRLAEQRSAELASGDVEPLTWTQIKQEL